MTETKLEQLKSENDIKLQCPEKQVYPFCSTTQLHVKGIFMANLKAKMQVIEVICVLGVKTAEQLGQLSIGLIEQVNTV